MLSATSPFVGGEYATETIIETRSVILGGRRSSSALFILSGLLANRCFRHLQLAIVNAIHPQTCTDLGHGHQPDRGRQRDDAFILPRGFNQQRCLSLSRNLWRISTAKTSDDHAKEAESA